ncbi:Exocyst complex component 2 [Armadillidium nasatum]|uniref:Exocyst complex component 2 n=1 Tax=Armadillidium nasatum TaxID=96803 RepID=A0A5N5SSJ5_9CRUS|nr:Exocyst complex component 2 [Armadillidium nasatum]
MSLAPVVTGISPIEGVPGTKVTIRGENLGFCQDDLMGLIICGVDCLMSAEWKSNNKIVTRSGGGIGKGDIIVVTIQGGRGTSTVQFKGLQEAMGPLKESAVWANVGSVLEQVDTLYDLKCVFESDIQEYGRQSTEVLQKAIYKCKEEADKLFEDVLHRKDRADGTRNAINVLKRFRFLFYLPVNTERNIQKGDYDVVINDYARAKSLFGDTQIQLFKKFYSEVEKKIEDLRNILSEQLIKMPTTLEYQKKIIRNLYHLETPGDPAWQCLGAQHAYILHLLMESRDSHLSRELADHDLGANKGSTPGPPVSSSSRNTTPAAKYNKIMMSSVGEWQASAPVRVLLIEDLGDILSTNFPDMWKLSQAYFGGELLPSSAHVDHFKHPECKEMILELLGVFSGIIRGAIIPQTLNPHGAYIRKYHVWPEVPLDQITPWLPQVLRHIRSCYNTLLMLDLPKDAVDVIKTLLFDLRVHCLTSLFQQTVDHLCSLHSREDWRVEVDDEQGGYTHLPQICEGDIIECAQLVKETVLEGGRREPSLLDHPNISKDIGTLIHNVIVAFAQALRKLTLKDPDDPEVEDVPDRSNQENGTTVALPSVEVQFLITLSNCAYMRRVILPRLGESLVRAGYPKAEVIESIEKSSQTYNELQETLFDAYLEERIDPIIGMIERSMYLGQYDWGKVRHTPTEVRSYVKEILLNVSQVHAEVVAVWPGLIPSLIERMVEVIGEEMARLITCVSSFSQNGALQAHIDLAALNLALNNYMSPTAQASFQEAAEALPKLTSEAKRSKENVLRSFHNKMKFLLACFLDLNPVPNGEQMIASI